MAGGVVSKARLEFLFDGIFAIAMTLLVLDIKVPELADRHSTAELARGLARYASTFGSFLLSFVVLGALWYRHNRDYPMFQRITAGMLGLHFVQLASAAFFPFCAALFGEYPFNPLSGWIYTGCIVAYSLAALGNVVIGWRAGALRADMTQERFIALRRRMVRRLVAITALFVFYGYMVVTGARL